MELKKFKKK